MADRRRVKKRKEEVAPKPTKQEYAIAKYIRGQLPQKKTTLFNHKVDYFVANKAINLLLDSPWAKSSKSQDAIFTTRESVVDYLDTMLLHNFFHRARKIPLSSKESKTGGGSGGAAKAAVKKTDESSDEQDSKKKKKGSKKDDKKKPEEKKKRKFKLDMHLDQVFVDGSQVFVWIYEPTPWKAWIIGSFFVVGAILLCLFPLWPQNVRKGVYYLSIAAAGFLVVILALAIIRVVVFCIVWGLSMGRHHLWLLPNLTEDVGFLESFWPLYKYDFRGVTVAGTDESKDESGGDKKSEDKQNGDETNEDQTKDGSGEAGGGGGHSETGVEGPVNGNKKRRRKTRRSKSKEDDDDNDDDDEEDENGDEGDSAGGVESKRPEDHTDTDRVTSDDEGDDKFEVLNADDVPESDNSDKPGT